MKLDPARLPPPPPRKKCEKPKLVLKPQRLSESAQDQREPVRFLDEENRKRPEEPVENSWLDAWQNKLTRKEVELELLAEKLREREKYVACCEKNLLERSIQLSEREAHIQQLSAKIEGQIKSHSIDKVA